jgi:hypothetical protein
MDGGKDVPPSRKIEGLKPWLATSSTTITW